MIKRLLRYLIKYLFLTISFLNVAFSQSDYHRFEIISKKPFELFINDYSVGIHLKFDTLLISNLYKIEAYLLDNETIKSVYKRNLFINSDLKIHLDNVYSVSVRSIPDDAQVFFDSIYIGSTPLNINLLFKPSFIEVKKLGHIDYSKMIGEVDNYNFFIKLDKKEYERPKLFFEYKYIALSSTIITGSLAAYTKQVANKYFYKTNRTDEDMRKVKIYDRYSGIFTIGMEISFGIFVYLLFQE